MQEALLGMMSARKGHFKLESGHHGDLWLELEPLFLRPGDLQPFASQLAGQLSRHNAEAVCGPLVGGAFLAQMLAWELDAEFYYTERLASTQASGLYSTQYHLPASLQTRIRGKDVVIVDDVINAGSSVRATMAALQACGAKTVAICALLTLGNAAAKLAADRNIALEYLEHLNSNLWPPQSCPLCASHVPLENG